MAKKLRNARCPKCGLKNKHCQCSAVSSKLGSRLSIIAGVASIILLVVIVAYTINLKGNAKKANSRPDTVNVSSSAMEDFRKKTNKHVFNKKDDWWLEKSAASGVLQKPGELDRIVAKTQEFEKKITEVIKKYKHVSPLAEKIAASFKRFIISLSYGSRSTVTISKGIEARDDFAVPLELQTDLLEICFVAREDMHKIRGVFGILYDGDIKAVRIMAFNWHSDPLFAGVIIHEMGHAWDDQIGMGKPSRPGSVDFASEEVDMHLLELDVFDEATDGQYVQYIDQIAARITEPEFDSFIQALEVEDLVKMEQILQCDPECSQYESRLIASNAVLYVGFRYLMKNNPDPRQKMIDYYQYIVSAQ